MKLSALLEEYAKHSALNFGQVLHGALHLGSHPDIDPVASRGTFRHFYRSALLRSRRLGNDLFFALIPPHWHHSSEELRVIRGVPMRKWFFYGFAAWRFTESGEVKPDLSSADPRWDPRCKASSG
jgi:hypothetical protein